MKKNKEVKHIALLLNELQGGGAERVMITLANHWAEQGLKVDVLVGKWKGHYIGDLSDKVAVVLLDSPIRKLPFKVGAYLRKSRPDILLSTIQFVNVAAALAGLLSGFQTRVVLREANTPSHKIRDVRNWKEWLFFRYFTRLSYPLAHGFISVSDGLRKEMARFYPIPERRIRTIYNPVVEDSIFEKAGAPVAHPFFRSGDPVVIGMGRIVAQKDFGTLISAFSKVQSRTPCRLIILGETTVRPPEYERLMAMVEELGLGDKIDFAGFQQNPFAFLAKAQVFVLSSRYEGLPGALIQALALGCHVVSTKCPYGPEEILEGGKYGALVGIGDYEAMAREMEKALAVPKDYARAEEAVRRFTREEAAEAYLDYFRSLM
jgi:glycosyltransferase involved in cell wall biosynthesis